MVKVDFNSNHILRRYIVEIGKAYDFVAVVIRDDPAAMCCVFNVSPRHHLHLTGHWVAVCP